MISDTGMRDLTVGQKLVLTDTERPSSSSWRSTWVIDAATEDSLSFRVVRTSESRSLADSAYFTRERLGATFELATPDHRISEGLYRHRAAGPDDVYVVIAVGILDEDGHGNEDAPRQVVYRGTRPHKQANIRSEVEFGQLVTWPDGIVRPRFVRMEYSK